MNILITTIFDYPHEGGLSSHITTLKKGLMSRGHTVDVLSFSQLPQLKKKMLAQAPGFLMNKVKQGSGQLFNDRQRQKLLATALKSLDKHYDVINAQDIFATLASVESGIPTVQTVHGYYSFEAVSRGALLPDSKEDMTIRELERNAYRSAAKVVTVDQRIKDYIHHSAHIEATAIKNFIDVTAFKPESEKREQTRHDFQIPLHKKMLFVPRRMTEKNGVIYPLLALPEVLETHEETVLVYAGTGEQRARLEETAASLQLTDSVIFLGSVPFEDMHNLYEASDVVLIPSVHSHGVEEATSISALEAMSCSSPVIASAIGGLKEIIVDGEDGLLVAQKDTKALSQSIVTLLQHPQYASTLALRARSKMESEYSHLAAAKRFEVAYKEALI
ncbi:glycosyltransferase family 4 protein [Peribacillus muralis]|uniref:glycosyltransferase family 4 protein n=1 Tax=Peribacillus muralis TaxID=264697 RepID=UPI001F4E47ED|nr:glycosyltransferase family 4 protein [Peribacillus muralis]MCK1994471.1 glycosyltransferase family 4 protein [Peribacillus muralis]MCK2014744.1 glycosyltransferase family 4 protein [Peribacillus muralis]